METGTSIVFFTAAATFSVLFFLDFSRSRGDRSARYWLRSAAGIGAGVLLLSDLLLGGLDRFCLLVDLMIADEVLMMYPCSFEKPGTALRFGIFVLVVNLLVKAYFASAGSGGSGPQPDKIFFPVLASLVSFVGYFIIVSVRKFSGIRLLFRNNAVWNNVEEYARFIYSLVFLSLCILVLGVSLMPGAARGPVVFPAAFALLFLYVLLFFKAVSGRTLLIRKDTETRIKEMVKGNLRVSYVDKAEEDRKMNNLYKRIMTYMAEKKPYLDSTFDMSDLADSLFSNKLYLSRTINILSGRNFRQFVNYHRIQYALTLMKSDSRLRVMEVSEMSGFHSVVSFNMAFKTNTGKTPSEWLKSFRTGEDGKAFQSVF